MSPFTTCSYLRTGPDERPINVLSIFVQPVPFSEELLDETIAPMLTTGGPFDRIHVHGVPEQISSARQMFLGASAVRARLKKSMPEIERQVSLISWCGDNTRFHVESLDGSEPIDVDIALFERRFSLYDAFVRHGGLVTAARGTHFTKPSSTHSVQFLRTANLLEISAVNHQLVFWLYPLVRQQTINRIVVDTSGITSVAYSLAYERVRRGVASALPSIDSHASYGGLDILTVPDPEHTIFLVSASTSGSLAKRLVEKGAKSENIFTLFFLGSATQGTVICDLNEHKSALFSGLPKIANFPSEQCPECRKHSYPIPIFGDQFRTEPANVDEITVALADFDETSRAVLDRLVSTGLFKVFKFAANRHYELYLDVDGILTVPVSDAVAQANLDEIRLRLARLVRRGMPVHLHRIVPTSYPGTDQIARNAHRVLSEAMQAIVSIKSPTDLITIPPQGDSATLVISGCFDDTYELMGISRDLRTVQPGGSITYVSPIFRASSDQERKRIESNLTFGDQGSKTFTLLAAVSIDLPICDPNHSWLIEYRRLGELEYWCDLEDQPLPTEIRDRIELLRTAPAIGLSDDLFWNSSSGSTLKLSADFTMIPTRDGQRAISQADVFAIVTSLFHKYRGGVGNKPKLVYKTYERTVIAPESFQRFSDGVLQAAFLRAARAGEIAYGNCDERVSERMLAFLDGEVNALKHGGGHAVMEYLIAMMIGRLTLHPTHAASFFLSVIGSEAPAHFVLIARFLKHELELEATTVADKKCPE